MTPPKGKPIEKQPTGVLLPPFWHAKHNYGIPYRPMAKPESKQEDWASVGRKFAVDVDDLIFFNFLTHHPDEVNWYLRNYVGCDKVSPSGNNWMFSHTAKPGYIYIPPAEDTTATFDPVEICVWAPDRIKLFMQRLRVIAQSMSGNLGDRVARIVQVILRVGYPACLDLWYYNDINITAYVDFKTTGAQLREMTKHTHGVFPFDGPSGLYAQMGTAERTGGLWRIHAVRDLFDEFACGTWDPDILKRSLENIEAMMYKGWYEMTLVSFKTHMGGGSAYDEAVGEFLNHVTLLVSDDNHLYSAFRE